MTPPGDLLPPVLPAHPGPPSTPPPLEPTPRAPARFRVHLALILLGLYVVVPAFVGAHRSASDAPLLPTEIPRLLFATGTELLLFGTVFASVAFLARLRTHELWIGWRGGFWLIPRAIGWSVALRILTGLGLGAGLLAWQFLRGSPLDSLANARPRVESMIDVAALDNPLYLALMLTLVSFVLAGLREELWRVGMIALLGQSMPRWFGGPSGPWRAILPIALLFGLGHTPQGGVGVLATTIIGLGLGAIMVLHRSLWDAVLAHGFFNATTFALLPWLARQLPDLLRSTGAG